MKILLKTLLTISIFINFTILAKADLQSALDNLEAKNYQLAISELTRLAEFNHYIAIMKLAEFNEKGIGLTRNYKQALDYYTLMANEGIPEAQAKLAEFYFEGYGTDKDQVEAVKWAIITYNTSLNKSSKIDKSYFEKIDNLPNNKRSIALERVSDWMNDHKILENWRDEKIIDKARRQELYRKYAQYYIEQLILAKEGDAEAQYAVALFLAIGSGNLKFNPEKAIEWATMSAEQGNVDAKRLVAAFKHIGNNEQRLMKAASTGELKFPATHILKRFNDIDQARYDKALEKKFKNALITANMEFPKSHLQLVEFYSEGLGTDKDIVKAATWAFVASASPHSNDDKLFNQVLNELSDLQRKIAEAEAEKWLNENEILFEETSWVSPADNNPNVIFKTKDYLYEPVPAIYRGYRGGTTKITNPKIRFTPQTQEELELFASTIQKAKNGDDDAKLELAKLYQQQIGVTYDGEEALKWIKSAADNGHPEGQYLYASSLYNKANYRPKKENPDEPEIIKYFTMAAEQGHLKSQGILANGYFSGINLTQNYDESFKWATIAASQGHTRAQTVLSELYFNGYAVKKNFVEAYKWGMLARRKLDFKMNKYLILLELRLTDSQKDEAEDLIDQWLLEHGEKPKGVLDKMLDLIA